MGSDISISAPKPSLRLEQQQSTRRKLVEAAYDVFSENGYEDATVLSIARRAGASRATFYLHFNTKAEVLAAAWEDLQQPKMLALFAELNAIDSRAQTAITDWLNRMLTLWEEDFNFTIASNQAIAHDTNLAHAWLSGVKAYFAVIPDFAARMTCGPDRAELRFIFLCAQLDRVAFHWMMSREMFKREVIIAELASC